MLLSTTEPMVSSHNNKVDNYETTVEDGNHAYRKKLIEISSRYRRGARGCFPLYCILDLTTAFFERLELQISTLKRCMSGQALLIEFV